MKEMQQQMVAPPLARIFIVYLDSGPRLSWNNSNFHIVLYGYPPPQTAIRHLETVLFALSGWRGG